MKDILWGPKTWGLEEMFTGTGRKSREAANKTTVALAQQQETIAEEARKKRIARKPVQTVLGGAQTPTEGVTLGS